VRGVKLFLGSLLLMLALVPAAQGAVTIGSDLTQTDFANGACGTGPICTSVNGSLTNGRPLLSPISGVVVRWRLAQGNNFGDGGNATVALRILRPATTTSPVDTWAGIATGPSMPVPTTAALLIFDSRIPIVAGDSIGLNHPQNHGVIGVNEPTGYFNAFNSGLADGDTRLRDNATAGELTLNADIEADADHDGYGDETQDLCPSNAAFHTACPLPPKKKCKKKRKHHSASAAKKHKKHCKKKKKRA
jgi:hypothetical protein